MYTEVGITQRNSKTPVKLVIIGNDFRTV